MITEEKVIEIISKKDPGEIEQIHVITKYIFDKTKEDISSVNINKPQHQGQYLLMLHMYNVAKQYYQNADK